MTQNDKVNDLFKNTLTESEIKHFFIRGFDKYIVCDEVGTLFVLWVNKDTQKYILGRTKLMLKKYSMAKIPSDVMPNPEYLYSMILRNYKIQERLDRELKPVFDVLGSFYDVFCEKTR